MVVPYLVDGFDELWQHLFSVYLTVDSQPAFDVDWTRHPELCVSPVHMFVGGMFVAGDWRHVFAVFDVAAFVVSIRLVFVKDVSRVGEDDVEKVVAGRFLPLSAEAFALVPILGCESASPRSDPPFEAGLFENGSDCGLVEL